MLHLATVYFEENSCRNEINLSYIYDTNEYILIEFFNFSKIEFLQIIVRIAPFF